MNGKIRVAVVGGAFSEIHIQGFKCCPEFEVVSICRRQKHLAEQTARKYNIERYDTDFDEMITSSDIDVVSLAVPHHLHYPMTLKAFDLGKHVICEKPLGLNVREVVEMIRKAEEKQLIHQTVFNWRFVPVFFHMKELIDEGEVGSVYHISFNWLGSGRRDRESPFTWRFSQAEAGYGALGDTGVHGIDLIHWMAGDFKRVISHMSIFVPEHKGETGKYRKTEVEDSCSFLGELVGGGQVIFHVSSVASCRSVIRLEIHGDKGTLGAQLFPRDGDLNGKLYGGKGATDLRKEVLLPERLTSAPIPLPEGYSPRALFFARFAERLAKPIRSRQKFSPDFHDGLRAQKVLQALTDSCQQQRWQSLAY
jgi:predicted dehydrogenase